MEGIIQQECIDKITGNMDYMEDTGKYRRRNMEKPGAREGQESTGDIGYKRGTIGQLHDDMHDLFT